MSDITFLLRYTPTKYISNLSQLRDTNEILRFKDGLVSERILRALTYEIGAVVNGDINNWIIVFIPACSKESTKVRYTALTQELKKRTGIDVCVDATFNIKDRLPVNFTGRIDNPTSTFGIKASMVKGKKIILIDDIFFWGTTFIEMSERLLKSGAKCVLGIIVSKVNSSKEENPDDPPEWNTRELMCLDADELELYHYSKFDNFENITSINS